MGERPVRQIPDGFHGREVDADLDRDALDGIFKEGRHARDAGIARRENPYAAGSEERAEWDAGWRATVDIEDDDSDTCYQKN